MNYSSRWRREGVTRHVVEAGCLTHPPEGFLDWLEGRQAFLLTASSVASLHLERLDALRTKASAWAVLEIADGESAKSLSEAEGTWRRLAQGGATRECVILALGGGATTDLAGFVAASYLRGVEFALLPTTTLAQVDAAVGGKNGVNLGGIKNVVGAVAAPAWVLADSQVLATEDRRQRQAGLVEALKLGVVYDRKLFELVEGRWQDLLTGDADALQTVIARAVETKLRVVEQDLEERSLRRVLNFGHTLGHGLEAIDRGQTLLHGEAVAYGILFAFQLANALGTDDAQGNATALQRQSQNRVASLLRDLDLTNLPELDVDDLLAAMAKDKKVTAEGVIWVLPNGVGNYCFHNGVESGLVRRELEKFLPNPWGEG